MYLTSLSAIKSESSPIRMLYLVTVAIRDPGELGSERHHSFHVANYHNAEALQRALEGPFVRVTFEPDPTAYIGITKTRSRMPRGQA